MAPGETETSEATGMDLAYPRSWGAEEEEREREEEGTACHLPHYNLCTLHGLFLSSSWQLSGRERKVGRAAGSFHGRLGAKRRLREGGRRARADQDEAGKEEAGEPRPTRMRPARKRPASFRIDRGRGGSKPGGESTAAKIEDEVGDVRGVGWIYEPGGGRGREELEMGAGNSGKTRMGRRGVREPRGAGDGSRELGTAGSFRGRLGREPEVIVAERGWRPASSRGRYCRHG